METTGMGAPFFGFGLRCTDGSRWKPAHGRPPSTWGPRRVGGTKSRGILAVAVTIQGRPTLHGRGGCRRRAARRVVGTWGRAAHAWLGTGSRGRRRGSDRRRRAFARAPRAGRPAPRHADVHQR